MSYKIAGVNIDAGNRLVKNISPAVKASFSKQILNPLGGFASLMRIDLKKFKKPVIVTSTDGVGSKLKIAQMLGKHDTIGQDLVAMSVNDIAVYGATPLAFLDYFACGKLDTKVASSVINGIAKACKKHGLSLVGGETAEMPGFYEKGEYDLGGFVVGCVDEKSIISGQQVKVGMQLVGIESSGLHSNGFSLVRKILIENFNLDLKLKHFGLKRTLGEELLTPTIIYSDIVGELIKRFKIFGMAHITGGGLKENIVRILPKGKGLIINSHAWKIPPIFAILAELGDLAAEELFRVFNMGIGYVVIVNNVDTQKIIAHLKTRGFKAYCIGEVISSKNQTVKILH
ncbi:MAG: phosphoribosylformylglycinamidine cyclo-ligase [Deltaproteobacteria bacterium]|nr:phosphoribosylformylglycinamidine cyclo-ligase [Deltaproteobacteria bacterium]